MPETDDFLEKARRLTEDSKRVTVHGFNWNKISKAPVSRKTCSTEEAQEAAKKYRLINESTMVESKDDYPLVIFTKGGISKCFAAEHSNVLGEQVEHLLRQLITVNASQMPSSKDKRHEERGQRGEGTLD